MLLTKFLLSNIDHTFCYKYSIPTNQALYDFIQKRFGVCDLHIIKFDLKWQSRTCVISLEFYSINSVVKVYVTPTFLVPWLAVSQLQLNSEIPTVWHCKWRSRTCYHLTVIWTPSVLVDLQIRDQMTCLRAWSIRNADPKTEWSCLLSVGPSIRVAQGLKSRFWDNRL